MLVSTGFDKRDYTWNLWPRDTSFAGFAAISDFAPDNANFTTTIGVVPEPGTVAMMLAGLLLLGGQARRSASRGPKAPRHEYRHTNAPVRVRWLR
nr:PEP-CTERM sorting domain-containing protein [Rubrivivax gelatinosus]